MPDKSKRLWEVQFLGDPDYGRDTFGTNRGDIVDAPDAGTAVRKAVAEWRRQEPEEDWYGEGVVIGVREVVVPPPVKVFVRTNGRFKLERAPALSREDAS